MKVPKVTAVMITGKNGDVRLDLAKAAITSFKQQTYQEKELVIVNTGPTLSREIFGDANIRELLLEPLPTGSRPTLGTLRNFGQDSATGDYIMQWDDDDWSHPNRMSYQMEAVDGEFFCIMLRNQVRYDFTEDKAIVKNWNLAEPPGIPGTILYPKSNRYAYRRVSRREDDYFIEDHFKGRCIVLCNYRNPEMYLRFYHGDNTWTRRHVMGSPDDSIKDLPVESGVYLEEVLATHYPKRYPKKV
jgi:glycosyltransferase involved in cell wall biosynthesis